MKEKLYFAYGSNMNLDQMKFRCPAATVIGNVRLEDYRMAFRGRSPDCGVATILPEEGSYVEGVLWKITGVCEMSLDHYEGYPYLYGKEDVTVIGKDGKKYKSMVYVMNAPHKEKPSRPSGFYINGVLKGCSQNGIETRFVKEAELRTEQEVAYHASSKREKKGHERRVI